MTTTATHLRTIALHWADLHTTAGMPVQVGAFGLGLRGYLAAIEELDAEEIEAQHHRAVALRTLERAGQQIGERPVPVRLHILDTMRVVEAALTACADHIAHLTQREAMRMPTMRHATYTSEKQARIAYEDRQRRALLARADLADPRRWRHTGRRSAPHAALWLLARIERAPGPCRRLTEGEEQRIGHVAAGAAERVERALDIWSGSLPLARPCPCGGRIEVHGGRGAAPTGHCTGCGAIWSEAGIIAA